MITALLLWLGFGTLAFFTEDMGVTGWKKAGVCLLLPLGIVLVIFFWVAAVIMYLRDRLRENQQA